MLEKYEFFGKQKGKHLLVLAAIHGNETAGTNAIRRLLSEFREHKIELVSGRLTLVPVCNPKAYEKDVRQIDENLNRVMKIHENPQTYEQKLANEICPLIRDCDIMLDLHSTHCEGDVPFAFCDYPNEDNLKLISGLPVKFVLEGWPDIYGHQDEIQDFSTERAVYVFGGTGTTLECGYHKAEKSIDIAYMAIINTLAVFGMIDRSLPITVEKQHILMLSYVTKKQNGYFSSNYKHLDEIRKGELIAKYDTGELLTAPDDGYILLPNHKAEIGAEWYYLGKAL